MRQTYTVTLDDGTSYVIDSDARDIRAWEAEYDRSFFGQTLSMTIITQVAYLAGKRTGVLNGKYDTYSDFERACVETRGRPRGTVGNPIRPVATDARSASSPTGSAASLPRSKRKDPK